MEPNNKLLIIFKYPRGNWNPPVINKFSNFYETEHVYISDYKNKNFIEIINDINNLIESKNIDIVVFDVDYFKFINLFFVEKINCKKKILISGDDFELHEMNSITASGCDLVLSGCPLSVLKYREKGFLSYWMHYEEGKINKNNNKDEKEIDVLFFGSITPNRKKILDYLSKEGIKLKNVGHEEHTDGLPYEDILKLISKSKIIINFSKSRTESVKNYNSENIYKFYYQWKGRMVMAGMCGSACVSEYSPGQELLFTDDEVPTFFTKEECLKILKELLSNKEKLESYTKKFVTKVQDICDDKKIFIPINNIIKKSDNKRVNLHKIPYWYLRIGAKQILLRNIKLKNLISTISQFNIIFSIIKNSNFAIKLLIISESIINIIWYSLTSSLKFKKE